MKSKLCFLLLGLAGVGGASSGVSAQAPDTQPAASEARTEPVGEAPPSAVPPAAKADQRPLPELIRDLGDLRWRVREAATEAVIERGPGCYDALKTAFDKSDSYEVRRRIKHAVREIYVRSKAGPEPAFLGIRLKVQVFPESDVGFANAVGVDGLIADTAAERGGLKLNDLIMAVNGRRFSKGFPGEQFAIWVKAQPPGTVCRLGILRGANGQRLKSDRARQVVDLSAVSQLALRRVQSEEDVRLEPGSVGLEVTAHNPASEALQLQPGDLIVSINGDPPPSQGALLPEGQIQEIRRIRGGKWVELSLSLGKRPRSSIQPGNAEEGREQASASFVYWWREHFDPQGLVEEGSVDNADPAWRLGP